MAKVPFLSERAQFREVTWKCGVIPITEGLPLGPIVEGTTDLHESVKLNHKKKVDVAVE